MNTNSKAESSAPYQPRAHAPDATAFVMCNTGEVVTFGELEARANQGAHHLRSAGLKAGDHIAILMENRREFMEVCFAADRAGVYYTTISTHLTHDEIAYILQDCGARMLIVSERFLELLQTLKKNNDRDCEYYLVGSQASAQAAAMQSWHDSISTQAQTPIADESQGLDMLYSSGTTGRPKGIKWPLPDQPPGQMTMLIDLLASLYDYGPDTRYLSPAPLYHAAPLRHSMVTIKMGGSAYIMDRFDAEESLRLIERYRITHSQWVPTMFVRLLKLPPDVRKQCDVSSMRMVIHAAAPCPIDIKRAMIDWWGPIIHEYYAGTENNGFTSITTEEWLAHPGSVGRASLGIPHICDGHGDEVAIGEEGEVYFENGHQFLYHNDAAKTAQCTNANGWTTLGDIGYLDDEGYLYLTDRKSFVIISGGVNIYPQETENVLVTHPAVLDAAVIGIPDEDLGEAVLAIVQLVAHSDASDELEGTLIAYCKAHLSSIKCPRSIEFREVLPRSATGKLYKRRLKDEYWRDKKPV
jgi:fatty-acyl-CoA synthase